MASMRKTNGQWVISIQSLEFNTTLSTKTDKKVRANRLLRAIESRVDEVKLDGSHPFYSWANSEQLAWIKTGKEPEVKGSCPVTVSEAIVEYLEFKKNQNKAFNTIEGYRHDLEPAKKKFGATLLKDLSAKKLQEWVSELAKTTITSGANTGKKLSVKTQKVKVDSLKRVVKYFQSMGETELNDRIFSAVRYSVSEPDPLKQLTAFIDFDRRIEELDRLGIGHTEENAFKDIILTEAQQKEQLEYLKTALYDDGSIASIRLFAAIYFCCCTGCRRSELTRVRRRDLLLASDLPTVTLQKRKGRKDDDILIQKMVLPDKLVPILHRLLLLLPENQECIFTSDDKHMTAAGFNQKLERSKATYLGKQLVSALAKSKWKNVAGWHLFRHTLASHLYAIGHSNDQVMQQIGWSSPEIAKLYQHQTFDSKSEIINSVVSDF